MNHETLRVRLSAIAAMVLAAGMPIVALASDSGDALEHQFIVRLAANQNIEEVAATYGAVVLARYEPRGLYLLGTDPNVNDSDQDIEFDFDDRIEGDEQNASNCVAEGHTQSFFVRVAEQTVGAQPVAGFVSLPSAHRISRGAGVIVAVLDTGVSQHAYLNGAIAPGGYNFLDNSTNVNDAGAGVMAGHGTFVSGLIHMVAPDATILPIRVMDATGMGSSFMIAEGIYHAIENGARVINISMSSPKNSSVVADAIAEAESLGIIVVAAMDNRDSDDKVYPAANAGVIAVASTDMNDVKSAFSGFGHCVDLCAPGEDLVSIMPNNQFAVASGTSFSAALVSGASALVTSRFQAQGFGVISTQILESALDLRATNSERAEDLGHGRVRPWQALQRLRPPPKRSSTR
ncbi:MAG: S8 family serine peptidase [Phycisphaerales bacterium]|nr:S8 family serine peptidase [Phycisphaerales bacterium]